MGLILAIEYSSQNNRNRLWLEIDSFSADQAFKNPSFNPFCLRNRWHNCFQLGLMVICSHIFREEDCCADMLASLGHVIPATSWYATIPSLLLADYFRDINVLSNFRFP